MQLHYHKIGEGEPIIILHGLFGSADNWLTVSRMLAESYQVYLPDQRNHGRSPWSEAFTYDAMSADLMEFIETHQIQQPTIIGHSMGGKAAMRFAVRYPDAFRKLVVVDMAPKYYSPHHQQILAGLHSLNLASLQSRQQADDQLAQHIPELGVRQFLLKNLYRNEQQLFAWRINLSVIAREIENVGEALVYTKPVEQPTLFLRGGLSGYVKDEDIKLMRQIFPQSSLETIPDAGHWLQAEKPKEFLKKVTAFIQAEK
ncbi:MAG: alpha/beta fold hydrolase [Bacteroidota bacterium]